MERSYKVALLASHPIQYHAPIFRGLATCPGISLRVFFSSDKSIRGYLDKGFGIPVAWDMPLLQGYESEFLPRGMSLAPLVDFLELFRDSPALSKKSNPGKVMVLFTKYTEPITLKALYLARRAGIPVMIRADNHDGTGVQRFWVKESVRRPALRFLYRHISVFLAVGRYMRRHFAAHGVPEGRIFDSPHCVDNRWFENQLHRWAPSRERIRKELGFGNEDFVFIFSGKLIPKKNPLLITEAFRRMRNLPGIGLVVVGDGALRPTFERSAKSLLGDRAVFPGFRNQSQLGKYYVASDALLLPSSWGETWGLVVNEAQIFGLPAIVRSSAGCREDLIEPGVTGLVFERDNAESLARAMARLSENPRWSKELGRNSRERANYFTVDRAVQGIVDGLKATAMGLR